MTLATNCLLRSSRRNGEVTVKWKRNSNTEVLKIIKLTFGNFDDYQISSRDYISPYRPFSGGAKKKTTTQNKKNQRKILYKVNFF